MRGVPVGLLLGGLLVSEAAAQTGLDPAGALQRAIAFAETSLAKGDLQTAERLYREALFEAWMLKATLARIEGRRPAAREALRNASLFRVESAEALRALAIAELQMGEAAPAVEILAELAKQSPKAPEILRLLARALGATGQLELAAQKLNEASVIASDDLEQTFLIATEYLWLKRPEAAERLFARLLAARPIPQTRVLLGRSYRDAGEYERARAELRAALAQDPRVRRAHYYLGMVLLADAASGPDGIETAIAEFREELKLAPDDALTNDQLGAALLEAGRPAEALPALEAAVRLDARWLHLHHLARARLALDQATEAAASSRRALELATDQGAAPAELEKIHYQLGLALRKLGAAAEAATQFSEARRVAMQGTNAPREEALAPDATGPTSEASPLAELPRAARQELERRVTESLARAYFNLGVLQVQGPTPGGAAERFARAAAFFEKAVEIDPDFPQVQSSLGVAYFNARQFDKATGPLTRALAARPDDAGLKRMLATSCLNTEAWSKAAALLQDDPERKTDASLEMAYGLALLRSGRAPEAEKILAGLAAAQGDSAELRVLLGQAYAEQKKYGPAIESLEQALRLKADAAEANGALGEIYRRQGRLAEAEKALRAELDAHPADTKAQRSLALVLDAVREAEASRPRKARP